MKGNKQNGSKHSWLLATLVVMLIGVFITGEAWGAFSGAIICIIIYLICFFVRRTKMKRMAEDAALLNERLLAVQNAISPVYSDTLTNPNQLPKRFQTYLANHTDALNDALHMIHKADNPKAYKEAKRKYDIEIDALCRAENQDLIPLDPLPSNVKRDFYENEPKVINEMLSRMWKKYQEQAIDLKTQKGKKNHIKSYFELLSMYTDMFYPENFTKIQKQRAKAREKYGLEEDE